MGKGEFSCNLLLHGQKKEKGALFKSEFIYKVFADGSLGEIPVIKGRAICVCFNFLSLVKLILKKWGAKLFFYVAKFYLWALSFKPFFFQHLRKAKD